ncbi:MAG: DUF5786 family protein [Halobacteriaceae archaeon]
MSMGAYDEDEHERREKKNAQVDIGDDTRSEYRGSVEFDAGGSADEMLRQFEELNSD